MGLLVLLVHLLQLLDLVTELLDLLLQSFKIVIADLSRSARNQRNPY
jgi:hypothetical protein